ncbi:unnamed protein product [Urochloa humidicola]
MHIIRAFTHLQVRRIPKKYILKRYTRHARHEVEWDRHDGVRIGGQASKEQTRLSKLLPKLMKLGRAGSRSDRAYAEMERLLDKITPGVEMFPRSTDDNWSQPGPSTRDSVPSVSNDESGPLAVLHDGMMLVEPPMSRTKGRSTGKQKKNDVGHEVDGNPLSTYTKENYGDKECHCCGVRGTHYSTTCPVNPDRSKAVEERTNKRAAKTVDEGKPRKKGRPKIKRDVHEGGELTLDELGKTQTSSNANRGRRGGMAARIGARRTETVNYQE